MISSKKLSIVMAILAAIVLGVGTASANLIANGDFGAGDSGFTSAYQYFAEPGTPATSYGLGYHAPGPRPAYTMKGHTVSGLIPVSIMDLGPISEITLRVQGI